MIVCIAEKPSVGMTIAKILGATERHDGYMEGCGYQVTWAYGHLCQLKAPEDYRPAWKAWTLRDLPILPEKFEIKLIDEPGVKKQFGIIKKLFSKAEKIINCGDAGQEGELIQRWIQQLAGVEATDERPIKRLWISSLTDEAIRDGFKNLKDQSEYDNLYLAGLTRAIADWLLGINCTRLYTVKYRQNREDPIISVGRVQTPTLGKICEREKERDNFKPQPYWLLSTVYQGITFKATCGRIDKKADVDALLKAVTGKPFTIQATQQKEMEEPAPQLYDLNALQVDCNRRYGYTASRTLAVLQVLYEHKYTTYPRVDTRYLTLDIHPKVKTILASIYGYEQFTTPFCNTYITRSTRIFDDRKVTDHHAIIPTGVRPEGLTDVEHNVYDLICRRFIAVFMPAYKYNATAVLGQAGDVTFKALGREVVKEGWRAIYKDVKPADTEKQQDDATMLPHFALKESGPHRPLLQEKQTTPPADYTDATLLMAMETAGKDAEDETIREVMKVSGIGRPSSRASIIDTEFKRYYARREGNHILPTRRGLDVMALIKEPLLKSVETTGIWEKRLREIERGTYQPEVFLAELTAQLRTIVQHVIAAPGGVISGVEPAPKSKAPTKRRGRGRPRKAS